MTTAPHEPIYASVAKPWLKYYDPKFFDQTPPECSAFEYVCRQNKTHLTETAITYYGRKITYADLIVNVKKTAAAFRAIGMKKGDIATVVSVMTPEVIYAFYAADMIGASLNLVDPRYSAEGIHEYIEEVDSRLLICLNVVYERCHQAAKRTHVEHVVVLSPADSLPLPLALGYKVKNLDKNKYHSNVIHWKQFLAAGKDESIAAEPYDPEHACVVVHTGGTTGSPKGVMLTDNNFNGIAMQFSACDTLFSKGQSLLNIMPPFIAYGFACGVHLPLTLGIKVVIIPNLDSNKLGSLIWKYKPEHMFGVPSHYQQLAVDPKLQNKDLSFIRNYAAGGDAIARGAEQTVNDFLAAHNVEFPIAKGYGMTEVASAATVAAGTNNKLGSVGIPMVNTIIAAFEPGTEKELPIGERGELCISGPTTMKGYYNKPEETDMILRRHADGQIWAHTGDVGYMDEDGFANQDGNQYLQQVKELADREGAQVLPICAKLEQDIAELDGEDRAMFLEELGIQESGLDRLIKCSYALLGLISFLTYGEDECRAWTIKNGTKAPQAAGKIHSDIERGFIRAETINFDDMIRCGSVAAAKEKGLLRSEGKEYVVKDGDMIYFRFNV